MQENSGFTMPSQKDPHKRVEGIIKFSDIASVTQITANRHDSNINVDTNIPRHNNASVIILVCE